MALILSADVVLSLLVMLIMSTVIMSKVFPRLAIKP